MNPERTWTRAAVAECLTTGESITDIARKYEIDISTLRRALRRHGVAPRPQGRLHKRRPECES